MIEYKELPEEVKRAIRALVNACQVADNLIESQRTLEEAGTYQSVKTALDVAYRYTLAILPIGTTLSAVVCEAD